MANLPPSPPGFPGGVPGSNLPQNFPQPGTVGGGGISAGVSFPSTPKASICGFSLGLPTFKFGFKLPSIQFPPALPIPFIHFKLSCKLPNPVDVTAGLNMPYGGGRENNAGVDPDDFSEAA